MQFLTPSCQTDAIYFTQLIRTTSLRKPGQHYLRVLSERVSKGEEMAPGIWGRARRNGLRSATNIKKKCGKRDRGKPPWVKEASIKQPPGRNGRVVKRTAKITAHGTRTMITARLGT